jgi:hypothetical protein
MKRNSNNHSGKCAICGCTLERGCGIIYASGRVGGCAWANEQHTLCTNSICLAVAEREGELLRALDVVLNQRVTEKTHGISEPLADAAWKRLIRVRSRFAIVDAARAKAGAS